MEDEGATPGLDLARLAQAEAALAGVEDALSRLDAGTWGACEACGEPIDGATLEVHPTARHCEGHG